MTTIARGTVTQMADDAVPPSVIEPVDQIAAAVLAVPGVHELHSGVLGEAATYLPGRRVGGIAVRDDSVEIHLVVDREAPLLATADAVRRAVEDVVPGAVHVTVEDVA